MQDKGVYFLDTEFADVPEEGFNIDFFSIGLVRRDGAEYYGVYDGIDAARYAGQWVAENVLAKLPPQAERHNLAAIREGLFKVFQPAREIEIWAHNGSYDFYILSRLCGGLLNLRAELKARFGIERVVFRDTKELLAHRPAHVRLPVQDPATEHISIHDARQERAVYEALQAPKATAKPSVPRR
jgi:hypothetical protein